jgi:SAM-dependent methyltransferase
MRRAAHYDAFVVKAGLSSSARSSDTRQQVGFVDCLLGLKRGAAILDLPCGNGRHALLLGRRGYRVTAVDASLDCIKAAQATASHRNVTYEQRDVTAIGEFGLRFDAVISLFSCIGYFRTDARNSAALRALLSVLKPGGTVVLSTANREFVRTQPAAASVYEGGGYRIVRSDHYDEASRCVEHRFRIFDKARGGWRSHRHRRRIYSSSELNKLFRACGVGAIECFADYAGAPFDAAGSPHAIYVGTKRLR